MRELRGPEKSLTSRYRVLTSVLILALEAALLVTMHVLFVPVNANVTA